jgi:hypothetical protein
MSETQKLIREARFGPPKSWKTGAVVTSYPRPLLCLECDEGGMDICPGAIKIKQSDFYTATQQARKDLPSVSYVDFTENYKPEMSLDLSVERNPNSFPEVVRAINYLTKSCPWRTVVLDSTSALQKFILGYVAATAPAQLADARKWAATVGGKIDNIITVLGSLKDTHVVTIMHEDYEKNELTQIVTTNPMLYSKLRLYVGGILSQFFYQKIYNGKPTLWAQDDGMIKGVGSRWPDLTNKKQITPPTCKEIYGEIT